MGIFDKWKKFQANRLEKAIASNAKLIRRDKVNKDERAAAIEFFCSLERPEIAVPVLLKRFDFSADNGIVDTRDKERALEGVIRFGQDGVPIIKEHMLGTTRTAWPLKALSKLVEESEVIEALLACLEYGDVSFDQAKIDKNYDLLCLLADYKFSGQATKLSHFLKDPDERVRYAVTELLVLQDDKEIPAMLEPFASDTSEENRRIRKTVLQAFADRSWTLKDAEKVSSTSPEGFRISKEGKVAPLR